jgi:hypothetical protein
MRRSISEYLSNKTIKAPAKTGAFFVQQNQKYI